MKCKKILSVRKYEMQENLKCKKIWNVKKYEM